MDRRKRIAFASAALAALLLAAGPGAVWAQAGQALPQPPPQGEAPQFGGEFGSGGWLGIAVADVTADTAKQLKLPQETGVLITDVAENTPAAKAGLKKDDVVTEYNGMKIASAAEFRRLVRETPPGRTAQMTVWHDGHSEKLSAQIGQLPATPPGGNQFYGGGGPAPRPAPNFRFAPGFGPGYGQGYGPGYGPQFPGGNYGGGPYGRRFPATPTLGIGAEDISGQLGEYFGAPNGEGVLVTEVQQGTPADKAGLKAGDVIVKLDNQQVRNVGELREQLRQHRSDTSVMLSILRKGAEMTLTVTPQQPPQINPGGPRRIPL